MAKIEIDHILCPMDFSAQSQHAYSHAVAMARWYDARITALHVVVTRPAFEAIPSIYTATLPPIRLDELRRELASDLERYVRIPDASELRVDVVVQEAPAVHTEILAQAGILNSDLIVIGTHGLGGFDRLVLGSVTEKVLRKASPPVLVIPPRVATPATSEVRFKRILCPVDFSTGAAAGLAYAVSLAEEADAELTLLNVVDDVVMYDLAMSAQDVAALKKSSVEALQQLLPADVRTYCSVETLVTEGRPAREILKAATARAADLVVMGVQGRNALDRMVFGSNTHAVIRAATCPVLTVRCPESRRSRQASSRGGTNEGE
jgi:nucleotide-binding universal stress UspA family protein